MASAFPNRLTLYPEQPSESIAIEEFEQFCLQRIQLLKSVEAGSLRNLREPDLLTAYRQAQEQFLQMHSNLVQESFDVGRERWVDCVSHFILILLYCKTAELQRWLLTQETLLFKLRWLNETAKERGEFLASLVSSGQLELQSVPCALVAGLFPGQRFEESGGDFVKVPFGQVLDLVTRRAVLLKDGFAFVPKSEVLSVLLHRFRSILEERLHAASKMLPRLQEADRILPLLSGLSAVEMALPIFSNSAANSSVGKLSASDVDRASAHFPPCMQRIHQRLKSDGHLKHGARMQYGLFLKSIGLSLEEAILFWRRAFAPKHSEDDFQRNYAYNIRHNYGQEGKRVDYAAYNCVKIITTNHPSSGDCHGCPFRHSSPDILRSYLQSYRSPNGGSASDALISEIISLSTQQHYQLACTRLLEGSRKCNSPMEPTSLPSKFYQLSLELSK